VYARVRDDSGVRHRFAAYDTRPETVMDNERTMLVQAVASGLVTITQAEHAVLCRRGVQMVRQYNMTPERAAKRLLAPLKQALQSMPADAKDVVPPVALTLRRMGIVEYGHLCLLWTAAVPPMPYSEVKPKVSAFLAAAHCGLTDRAMRTSEMTREEAGVPERPGAGLLPTHAADVLERLQRAIVQFNADNGGRERTLETVQRMELACVHFDQAYGAVSVDDVLDASRNPAGDSSASELAALEAQLVTSIEKTNAVVTALSDDKLPLANKVAAVQNAVDSNCAPTLRSPLNALLPAVATQAYAFGAPYLLRPHVGLPL
jgi:hypothetical protein